MRTSRAFDIQEKRGSAVNTPPNIQRSGSLLDKHSSSESDLEPTETSWKSHKIFFITQAWFSSGSVWMGSQDLYPFSFYQDVLAHPSFLAGTDRYMLWVLACQNKENLFNVWDLFARYFLSGFDESWLRLFRRRDIRCFCGVTAWGFHLCLKKGIFGVVISVVAGSGFVSSRCWLRLISHPAVLCCLPSSSL